MIIMTMLTGPYAGQVRSMSSDVDPLELITSTVRHGWRWMVVYQDATPEEVFEWARADLIGRILLALQEGRSVWFQGAEYRAEKPDNFSEVAGSIEDAVANSGMLVHVESDDERGVLIGIGGTELPVQ